MPSPLSVDLRERVVAAVAEGASFHRAAARFGVSVSSASRWSERFAQEGHVAPKPTHGDDILDNLGAHKVAGVRAAIEAAGRGCSTSRPTARTSTRSSRSSPS
jgi:transposase-like protein